jgi:hypothetical protein
MIAAIIAIYFATAATFHLVSMPGCKITLVTALAKPLLEIAGYIGFS